MENEAIKTGVPVVLNIGLWGKRGREDGLTPGRRRQYMRYLNCIMRRGFTVGTDYSGDEPTWVVTGMFEDNASLFIPAMVDVAQQDCIAIYYPEHGMGYLVGPRAYLYGQFDRSLFKGVAQ